MLAASRCSLRSVLVSIVCRFCVEHLHLRDGTVGLPEPLAHFLYFGLGRRTAVGASCTGAAGLGLVALDDRRSLVPRARSSIVFSTETEMISVRFAESVARRVVLVLLSSSPSGSLVVIFFSSVGLLGKPSTTWELSIWYHPAEDQAVSLNDLLGNLIEAQELVGSPRDVRTSLRAARPGLIAPRRRVLTPDTATARPA